MHQQGDYCDHQLKEDGGLDLRGSGRDSEKRFLLLYVEVESRWADKRMRGDITQSKQKKLQKQ